MDKSIHQVAILRVQRERFVHRVDFEDVVKQATVGWTAVALHVQVKRVNLLPVVLTILILGWHGDHILLDTYYISDLFFKRQFVVNRRWVLGIPDRQLLKIDFEEALVVADAKVLFHEPFKAFVRMRIPPLEEISANLCIHVRENFLLQPLDWDLAFSHLGIVPADSTLFFFVQLYELLYILTL